ncbi:MAG TPA: DnaJ domain-containing protein, partial [Rubrobacter sp.]|nr:DnaJ domain-containing protein [Rubrobacter sp.]
METRDLYKVLEVGKGASQEEIRRSYRRLARKHHPDANREDPKAEERFKEVQHAYEILSNPEKRREYDEGPRAYFGARAPAGGAGSGSDPNFSDLSDLFGSFGGAFGGAARGAARTTRGEDVT